MSLWKPTRPAAGRYAWLFDQRFEPLRASFEAFLASQGYAVTEPVDGFKVLPDVTSTDAGGLGELRQLAPETLNQVFALRWRAGERWGHSEAAPLPVVGFTLDGLGHVPGLQTFGASPAVVHALNDKTLQYRCFRDLGLPVPAFDVIDARLLDARAPALLSDGPVIVQPAYSAGGEQASIARSPGDLAAPTDAGGGDVVVARYIPGCRTLSGNGIVTRVGDVLTLGVTELLQDGLRFDGFIFPTFEGSETEACVDAITVRIGAWLRELGYWGFFTADLIRRPDGALFVTEANVRFSGEAAFLDHYVPYNLFGLIASTVVPSNCARSEMRKRIVVTKIRPRAGQIAGPIDGPDEAAFLSGAVDAFRVGYLAEPVRVVSAHFIGLAGARLPLSAGRDAALQFYQRARRPYPEEASQHHGVVQ